MKKFEFNGKLDVQTDEFKEFIQVLKNENKVKIVFETGTEIKMNDIREEFQKIAEILPKTMEVELQMSVNEKLDKNTQIITLDV